MQPKVAVIIAHYGPDEFFREMLWDAVAAVRRQHFDGQVEIAVVDDGSAWSDSLADPDGGDRVLGREAVLREPLLDGLDVDWFVVGARTDRYRRAIVTNLAARTVVADAQVYLDDDTRWRGARALGRLVKALDTYDFAVGRIQRKNGVFDGYYDPSFSGTNLAMRRDFLEELGWFGEYTAEWGHGFDNDLFWRVYAAVTAPGSTRRAAFVSDVLTERDGAHRRRKHLVTEVDYVTGFEARHGVNPRENASRRKQDYLEHTSSNPALMERLFDVRSRAERLALRVANKARRLAGRS